jgi:hypothetical protein
VVKTPGWFEGADSPRSRASHASKPRVASSIRRLPTALIARGAPVKNGCNLNTLAVWDDQRGGNSIFGARVTNSGGVLDQQGIPISLAPSVQHSADVAADTDNFLVVWADERFTGLQEIYGTRVTGTGGVLDPSGIPLSTGSCCRGAPTIARGLPNYLVAWTQSASGASDIRGTRVTTGGVVLDPSGFTISSANSWQFSAAISWDGTNYFVVWEDERASPTEIYGTRVSPAGVVLDPEGIRISNGSTAESPAIDFDGVNYLVTWEDGGAGPDVYGARVTPGGTVLDPSGIPISTASGTQTTPAVAFGGANWLVVWHLRPRRHLHTRHLHLHLRHHRLPGGAASSRG